MPCDRYEIAQFVRLPASEVIARPPDPPKDGEPANWMNIAWMLRPDPRWAASLDDAAHDEQHDKTNRAIEWALHALQTNNCFDQGILPPEDELWVKKMAQAVVSAREKAVRDGAELPRFGTILTPSQRRVAQRGPDGSSRIVLYCRVLSDILKAQHAQRVAQDDIWTRAAELLARQQAIVEQRVAFKIKEGLIPAPADKQRTEYDFLQPEGTTAEEFDRMHRNHDPGRRSSAANK